MIIFFLFFPEYRFSLFMQIVSFKNVKAYFSRKKKESVFEMSSAEIFIQHAKH